MSFKKTVSILLCLATIHTTMAGPYPPPAEDEGSDAIHYEDSRIVAWATAVIDVAYGLEVADQWKNPEAALGPAGTNVTDVMVLGQGGWAVFTFDTPIRNGEGPDFLLFENGISDGFLEFAFVDVSSDGENWFRFPVHSEIPSKVPAFGSVDVTQIIGVAGRYRIGWGTPFDLVEHKPFADETIDLEQIRYVRITDIVGDGRALDSSGNPIYDPYPTQGSAGYDADAVGVIHRYFPPVESLKLRWDDGDVVLSWPADAEWRYAVQKSSDLVDWETVEEVAGEGTVTEYSISEIENGESSMWRVVPVALD